MMVYARKKSCCYLTYIAKNLQRNFSYIILHYIALNIILYRVTEMSWNPGFRNSYLSFSQLSKNRNRGG